MEVQESILKYPFFAIHNEERGHSNLNCGNVVRKRQRLADENDNDILTTTAKVENKRKLLHFANGSGVYQTDVFKQSEDTIFLPLPGDLFVNLERADEITFSEGLFFTGDTNGRYCNSVRGNAMHIWRYSDTRQLMVISKSFLITEESVLNKVKDLLLNM